MGSIKLFYGLTKAQVQQYIDGIYNGDITEDQLSPEVYLAIGEYLLDAVEEGFGMKIAYSYGKDLELLNVLRDNVFMFAAGKDYEMTKAISSLLTDEKDNIRTNKEFNKIASATYDNWMNNYGETEYSTALGQAYSIQKWKQIELQKDILPNLRYSTIDMPCDICAPLNNLVAPVDDPIWLQIAPLNHFNCRCILIQLPAGVDLTPQDDIDDIRKKVLPLMQAEFKSNPGQDKLIFNEAHPYFHQCLLGAPKASAEPLTMDCHNNFGLGKPEEIKNKDIYSDYAELNNVMQEYKVPKERANAIKNYTTKLDSVINRHLRGFGDEEFNAKADDAIPLISEFIHNAPKYDGIVYRGLSFNLPYRWDEFNTELKEGAILTDKGFMSTSAYQNTAVTFASRGFGAEKSVLFEIHSKNGVAIEKYSGSAREKEILFDKGTQIKIIKIEKNVEISEGRKVNLKIIAEEVVPEKIEEPIKLKTYKEAFDTMKKYKVSKSTEEAIMNYSSSDYRTMNQYLREGNSNWVNEIIKKKDIEQNIPNLTKFLNEAPKVNFTTYRGLQLADEDEFNIARTEFKEGEIIKDKGFLSTSTSKESAEQFTFGGDYHVIIEVQGKNGVLIEPWTEVKSEREVLFAPNTKFKVLKAETEDTYLRITIQEQ